MNPLARAIIRGAAPAGPSLPIDWSTDLIFARASAATYWDGTTFTRYAAGSPRVLADGSLYVEGARTNYAGNSVVKSPWVKTTATVNFESGADPGGGSSASESTVASVLGPYYTLASYATAGVEHPLSFFLKGSSVSGTVEAGCNVYGEGTVKTLAFGTGWARVSDVALGAGAQPGKYLTLGNSTTGYWVWGAQMERAVAFPSQLIESAGGVTTRPADNAKVLSALVPEPMRSGRFAVVIAPRRASTQANDTTTGTLFAFGPGTANRIYIDSSNRVVVRQGGVDVVTTGALTWSADQPITLTIDAAGSVTVSGATTGDGVTTGTAWMMPGGDMQVGNAPGLGSAFFGAIGQPLVYSGDEGGVYLGQVATRARAPVARLTSGTTQAMSRTRHIARDTITSLRIVMPNWYGVSEVAIGATATVTASIEYPAGTFTQVLFSGIAAGSIASGGQLTSDEVSIAITDGDDFFVRCFYTCASGVPYCNRGGDSTNGDIFAHAASGLTDQTMANPMPTATNIAYMLPPVAIIAPTTKPSVMILGDSRSTGYIETVSGSSGDLGEIARSIGPLRGYIVGAIPNERASHFTAGHTNRIALAAFCSHVVCQYGINDIGNSASAATTYALVTSIRDLCGGLPFYQSTTTPVSTSTDSWATTVNQTTAAYNGERVAYNDLIRANGAAFTGFFEVTDVVETARDSGIWLAPSYTTDGVHPTTTASVAIETSGAIDPTGFTR